MAFHSLMHERNIYKERPDFAQIAIDYPEFRKYAISDAKGKIRVDFTNHDALRVLTKILLKKDFNLKVEIPKGFLIPTVPQRLNYILWIEDLLSVLPDKNEIPHGIDIGCGPCAIFSILGAKKNGWKFTATETANEALQWAIKNISDNDLNSHINVVKVSPEYTLNEVLSSNKNIYDFCLCNPPFYENVEEIRKKNPKVKETIAKVAKEEEIVTEGGEVAFVKKIINESLIFKDRIRIYTSMFGKKKSFLEILNELQHLEDITFTNSQFCQGNTIRWGIAWTFSKSIHFKMIEIPKRKKPKKVKPPLTYPIPKNLEAVNYIVQDMSKYIWDILKDAKIEVKILRSHQYYTESEIIANENTWSHQRRKKRELKRSAINNDPSVQNISETSIMQVDNSSTSFENKPTFQSDEQSKMKSKIVCVDLNCKTQNNLICTENVTLKRKINYDQTDFYKKRRLDTDSLIDDSKFLTKDSVSTPNQLTSYSSTESIGSKEKNIEADESAICSNIDSDCITFLDSKKEPSVTVYQTVKEASENELSLEEEKNLEEHQSETENVTLKRKINYDQTDFNKKRRLDTDSLIDDSKFLTKDSVSTPNQLTSYSSTESIGSKEKNIEADENAICSNIDSDCITSLDSKKEPSVTVYQTVKEASENELSFEDEKNLEEHQSKALLFAILKIRKAKDFILLEINCPADANRESLHQIFQFLKNKLK